MGPSGAGKSTFLDALAGRISSGALGGNVLVDGQEVTASEMKILSAYVMQVHLECCPSSLAQQRDARAQ